MKITDDKSKVYLAAVEKLCGTKNELLQIKNDSLAKVEQLTDQLKKLDDQVLDAADVKKARDLQRERRALILAIEDAQATADTDIYPAVKAMYGDMQAQRQAALDEYNALDTAVQVEVDAIWGKAQDKIKSIRDVLEETAKSEMAAILKQAGADIAKTCEDLNGHPFQTARAMVEKVVKNGGWQVIGSM